MKRAILLALILTVIAIAIPGCNCGQQQAQDTEPVFTGFTNPEDLGRVYLKAIQDKDIETLKTLFINPADLKALKFKKAADQHWETYFTHNKRLFLNKNKNLLGTQLTFLSFRSGTEVKLNPDISVFRGAQVLAEQADKKRVTLEINFLVRTKGYWKILLLRYLHPSANIGQGPSPKKPKTPGQKPSMNIPGPKPKMEIKVKKVEKEPAAAEGSKDKSEESLDELKKLFQ